MPRSKRHPQREAIVEWLRTVDVYALAGKTHREVFDHSYPTWARNGRSWDRQLATGGTYTLRAIMWYQHVYRPGSTDSRPAVILAAIVETMQKAQFGERACRVCGCTTLDCSGCIERTGQPCAWAEPDLCTACL